MQKSDEELKNENLETIFFSIWAICLSFGISAIGAI